VAKARSKKEDLEKVKVAYIFPASLKRKLSELATAERRSVNAQIIVLLETAIEQHFKKPEVVS
jgi:hypothetical protein